MSLLNRLRLPLTAMILASLALPCAIQGAAETPSADPSKLAAVVGRGEDWKITPPEHVLRDEAGQTMLAGPAGQTLTLESNASLATPSECLLTFRLKPAQGGWTTVQVQMACAERADKSRQSLTFYASATSGQNSVNYGASVEGGQPPPPLTGVLFFEAVSERSLAWSEEMRQSIEAQISTAPKVAETLMTIRCTVEKGRFRAWLHGRFVSEIPLEAGMNPSGIIRIQVWPGAELASVRAHPLAAVPGLFEPLSIAGHLNAAPLNGKTIDPTLLPGSPAANKLASVDGVPFWFPTPSARGEDHIDVGISWTRFGALPGLFGANSGGFGGRWVSADRIDPARLAMYIPKGRYKALHLIAVSDGRKDSTPIVTAQFYRPNAGHPIHFAGTVPTTRADGSKTKATPVKLEGGKSAGLYHVVIPLDPDSFSWFTDLNRIGLEITKEVQFYRAYPDPFEYSWHGAGLPSSVQIYAMTLEGAGVGVDLQPDPFGHVWTAPASPSYTVQLQNSTGAATTAKLTITTKSNDGKDTTLQEQQLSLPNDGMPVKLPVTLKPTRYGLHELTLALSAAGETTTCHRNFVYLHEDTRERETWESGRGSIFGFWAWSGGHDTLTADKEYAIMAAAGAETSTATPAAPSSSPELKALAEKYHITSESAFQAGAFYYTLFKDLFGNPGIPEFDRTRPEESGMALVEALRKMKCEPSAICRPTYLPFFAEPQIGPITMGIWPSHYGEEYQLTQAEQAMFENLLARFLVGARAVRKEWPDLKLLLPYGDPMNTAVFLRLSPEARELIDGVALDMPCFERLPEQQINQVVLHRLYTIMKDIHSYKKNPYLLLIEGFCVSAKDIDTGEAGQADICTRNFLLLMGYGVTRFESCNPANNCANYWGEQHYGGGLCSRLPLALPTLAYVNYATITRHLNRANFTKYLSTGSTSTFCQQFKHYKTGKLIHVLWTVRGRRPVNVVVSPGATLEIYDQNDNVTPLREKGGIVTFQVDQSPQYLEGLTADAEITLGESDHSDAAPALESLKLCNLSSWKLEAKEDQEYAKNKPLQIERFLGGMSARKVEAPKDQGGKAMSVHLEKQDKDRGVMPFYATLEPKRPIPIAGKASHMGLWVHAASDWGRVVYFLHDAKGEKWISVGTKEEWNNDDIHCWSAFCFDGWRYLRFQMPSSAPYDSYREYGTTWWGSYGGDGVVDLPLRLVKIIVERRPKAIYGNDLVPTRPDDVLLGDLYAEYSRSADRKNEAVRLSRLRMPVPKGIPALDNPIAELAKTGVGAPITVLKVRDPAYQYDGTRCHVDFEPVAGAKTYDVWASPYGDGRGAQRFGVGWTEPGKLIEGLRPDVEFHLFVVYTDKDGKLSKPSEPFKFMLKNRFVYQ